MYEARYVPNLPESQRQILRQLPEKNRRYGAMLMARNAAVMEAFQERGKSETKEFLLAPA